MATEAANAVLAVGFNQLNLDEIVSFTATINTRSSAVMERLQMIKEPGTFEHPALPVGHKLREHCLFRLSKSQWCKNTQ
ncbi:GNAT family N-acetyltransferase [Endozoicomonas montiporae]|uniref:GNAT family N-acetyltransferase n=1 Tax=Endozoicomonas montiporae TaxID=1027273 RepID=UPI00068B8C7C